MSSMNRSASDAIGAKNSSAEPGPAPPAPADGDAGGAGPGSAELFLAPMASDALRFMLDMDADVQLFIDRLREGCAAYVAGMREAL